MTSVQSNLERLFTKEITDLLDSFTADTILSVIGTIAINRIMQKGDISLEDLEEVCEVIAAAVGPATALMATDALFKRVQNK